MTTNNLKPARYLVEQLFGSIAKGLGDTDKGVIGYASDPASPHSNRIPAVQQGYVFRRGLLRDILVWHRLSNGEGLYLSGPTGSGKSSVIAQVCARLGVPLLTAIGHQAMEIPDLVGGLGVKDGATFFREGPLTIALRYGFWFILDEVDLLNPGTATALNQILDGQGITIQETGEFIRAHRFFRFIVTGNTFGDGFSEHYIGTQKMNLAFLDRFIKARVDYPSEEEEMNVLNAVDPSLDESIKRRILSFAHAVRNAFTSEHGCNITLSTRSLVQWLRYTKEILPILYAEKDGMEMFEVEGDTLRSPYYHALERIVLFQADAETHRAVTSMFQQHFSGLV